MVIDMIKPQAYNFIELATNGMVCNSGIEYFNLSDKRYLSYELKICSYWILYKNTLVFLGVVRFSFIVTKCNSAIGNNNQTVLEIDIK